MRCLKNVAIIPLRGHAGATFSMSWLTNLIKNESAHHISKQGPQGISLLSRQYTLILSRSFLEGCQLIESPDLEEKDIVASNEF